MEKEDIQDRALEEVLKHFRCGVGIGTGVGKTRLGLRYIEHYYTDSLSVLILAPRLEIFNQWTNEAKAVGLEHLLDHIKFSTYLSIDKCSLDHSILVMDEFHNIIEDSHEAWLSKYQGRILGLSGSPPKYLHSGKGRMMQKYCPLVFTYPVDEAIEDKILNDYRIITHPLELGDNKDLWIKTKNGGWWTSEKENYNYWTKRVNSSSSKKEQQIMRIMRMKALMNYRTKEDYAKVLFGGISDKAILFANERDQVDRMTTFTYHSGNRDSEENLELFRDGKILKLGAVQMLSEGVNIPGLKEAVVMHSFSGASPKTKQKLGRILRLNPDDMAMLHVLYYKGTVDQTWMNSVLSDFDPDKITEISETIKT